jgi:4-aminobutyrate aminotransferase-like enzyme/Ser/Thr protein kinase RdoA (MazF antagonist)
MSFSLHSHMDNQLMQRAGQAAPQLTREQALAVLREHYGLDAEVELLGSQQDLNFRVTCAGERYVLKICHASYATVELQAQHAALVHVHNKGLPVPLPIAARNGHDLLTLTLGDQPLHIRLLQFIDGETLTRRVYLPTALVAELGRTCARLDQALHDFDHPGLQRALQWDPRQAQALIRALGPGLAESPRRAALLALGERAGQWIDRYAADLPEQAVHLDLTDDNSVWRRDRQREWQLCGIIDFGDLVRSWRVADLSVTCAALLHHVDGDPFAVLAAVRAYHASNPLSRAELCVLWPLIVARAVVVVLSSERQLSLEPDNAYVLGNREHEWQIFDVASSVSFELMEAAILDCVGLGQAEQPLLEAVPLIPQLIAQPPVRVELGVLAEGYEQGNWTLPGIDRQLLAAQAARHGAAASLYGQFRLSRTCPDSAVEPETCALHVELHLPAGSRVQAPFAGVLRHAADGALCLDGSITTLRLSGVQTALAQASRLQSGDTLGESDAVMTVQLCRHAECVPPAFVRPGRAKAWQALCPSPSLVLGWDCDAAPLPDPEQSLARRNASFARSQKHYYPHPPQIERGWRNHLIDLQGRSYLDMLNNVAVLGHGHPRMAQVASRQWSLLNTNSRFHYAAIADFSERLLALAPSGMDRVFLVNSGTEANDLAIRLAWAWRGGRDVLSVLEAYHGWSVATDAVSTSIADNPQALETRPDWVHPVMAPNTYRGPFRGPDSAPGYVRDVERVLQQLQQERRQVAGFICEAVYGNAGGIALPPGYLQQVYTKVRAAGGLCIADEVQVGYGRLGDFFWGFEEQGVVPDIITLAKGMGNGHPLGAVITRREVAEALEAEGYFFSSAGASPVSCQIGLAVLDVMAQEQLRERAREVGGYFKARLQALAGQHRLIGAVHGSGFYLGVELVRDRLSLEPATEETALLCERLRECGIFMQPTGDHLNILKIKPPMVTTRQSVDFFVDQLDKILAQDL